MMNPILQVALGGAAGSVARYGVTRAAAAVSPGFPLGTLIVNVAGSLAMGVLAAALLPRAGAYAPLLMTGLLGGFTTFSAFSLDAVTLWTRGAQGLAVGYVAASVTLSLAALALGLSLGRPA